MATQLDAFDSLETLDDWWLQVTEYANDEGNFQLRDDFYDLCQNAVRIAEFTDTDPSAFKYLGDLIKRREGIGGPGFYVDGDPHATISEIVNATYRAVPVNEAITKVLTAKLKRSKKRGRPKKESTKRAEDMLQKGDDVNAVAEKLKLGAKNVRKIKSRLGKT